MSSLVEWLSIGDLRSDGAANEIAALVLQNPDLIEDLMDALRVSSNIVRGHAADALEKVARSSPRSLLIHLDEIMTTAVQDEVPMVRWHLAMILGYLSFDESNIGKIIRPLFKLLNDESVFVRSWSIVSLCIIARKYPQWCSDVLREVAHLKHSDSAAIRTKVRQAVDLLTDSGRPFPKGWDKSGCL
jgi:hypothetical protein